MNQNKNQTIKDVDQMTPEELQRTQVINLKEAFI